MNSGLDGTDFGRNGNSICDSRLGRVADADVVGVAVTTMGFALGNTLEVIDVSW